LKKADTVVSVEANPVLCAEIKKRFELEIVAGRLFIENCVLTPDESGSEVPFYIHKYNHVLSQFPKPEDTGGRKEDDIRNYEQIMLRSQSPLRVIKKYGEPYYIKIDIERFDEPILRALFQDDVRPPYISAESHNVEVFCMLVSMGKYNAFKLVDGRTISERYRNRLIKTSNGLEPYSFPHHSAGPFGEDIDGEWMTANNFLPLLAFERLGWKDIHATNQVLPNPNVKAKMTPYVIKRFTPKPLRKILRRFMPS